MSDDNRSADYLDTRHTAQRLGVSASFLNKARITGDGPRFIKAGAKVIYHWPTVEAWFQSQARRSTSEKVAA